jgi:predicted 3-demethylubiquinone-9 3-methyltransferase (glyoxalase superfamily)
VSLFADGRIIGIIRYGEDEPGAKESVKRATFSIANQIIHSTDSTVKHGYTFTPSLSLFVECESEDEIDRLYASLAEGGSALMPLGAYGLSSKFALGERSIGVSWQLNLR